MFLSGTTKYKSNKIPNKLLARYFWGTQFTYSKFNMQGRTSFLKNGARNDSAFIIIAQTLVIFISLTLRLFGFFWPSRPFAYLYHEAWVVGVGAISDLSI